MILRIKFSKHGAVRYIGHLDVMRFFQKAVRRAGIDVKYTSGFSPHQVMSFAQPLSVGHESNGEYMDIEVNSMESCEEIKNRLNEASVPGLTILSVRILPKDAGNAMASVAAARYSVYFKTGKAPLFISGVGTTPGFNLEAELELESELESKSKSESESELESKSELESEKNSKSKKIPELPESDPEKSDGTGHEPGKALGDIILKFLSQDEILITKEGKSGLREVNIRPGIYELTWEKDHFSMLVDASSAGNIKPVQVLEALCREAGEELKDNAIFVVREETYTNIGEDGKHILVPLDAMGMDDP